jgi:uncharacterized integral membrane protein
MTVPSSPPPGSTSQGKGPLPVEEPDRTTLITRARLAAAGGLVVLLVVLVFILQNLQTVRITFFAAHWRMPLGVGLLMATVFGGLLVFAAGSLRLLQLRRTARRRAQEAEKASRPRP